MWPISQRLSQHISSSAQGGAGTLSSAGPGTRDSPNIWWMNDIGTLKAPRLAKGHRKAQTSTGASPFWEYVPAQLEDSQGYT